MKFFTVFVFLLLTTISTYSQDKVDSLIQEGIECFNLKNYRCASECYETAIKLDPLATFLHYECAKCYYELNEYEKVIKHCAIVVESKSDLTKDAMLLYGIALYKSKKNEYAIQNFQEMLVKFGPSEEIYFNLAISHYLSNNLKEATDNIINAIKINPSNPDLHLVLGDIISERGFIDYAFYSYFYFLLLEPLSERSEAVLRTIKSRQSFYGTQEDEKIIVDHHQSTFLYRYYSSVYSANAIDNLPVPTTTIFVSAKPNDFESFIDFFRKFFNETPEKFKEKSLEKSFWAQFYAPFFYDLEDRGHIRAFCYYISQTNNENSKKWIELNKSKIEKFINWLKSPNN